MERKAFTVNIEITPAVEGHGPTLNDATCVALAFAGVVTRITAFTVRHTADAVTLVATFDYQPSAVHLVLHGLAERLGEDCIAYRSVDGAVCGLAGPRAERWAPFDERYFIR